MALHPPSQTFASVPLRTCGVRLADPMLTAGSAPLRDPREVAQLISSGPAVLICGQELGAAMLLKLVGYLAAVRPDVLALVDESMACSSALDGRCIYFSGIANRPAEAANYRAVRRAVRWLGGGGALLMFPAGERSRWTSSSAFSTVPWSTDILRWMRPAKASAIPVFAGWEGSQDRSRRAVVRVGEAIPFETLAAMPSERQAVAYLRWRTDILDRENYPPSGRAGEHANPGLS